MKKLILIALQGLILGTWAGSPVSAQQSIPASTVPGKSLKAIGYPVGGGSTKVDLTSTEPGSGASGEAKVEATKGRTTIEAKVEGLRQPSTFGAEFLTYVAWSVSPEGRTTNLGEVQINNDGKGELKATTQLPVFSLIVTAEPYFAVRQPSENVVLENELRNNTKGKIFVVSDYQLMRRGQYQKLGNPLALSPDLKNVPLEVYEARNAVDIAKSRGADKYAQEIFGKADGSLKLTESSLARKADKKETISLARQAVQFSEDARALAVVKQEEERIANERAAAAASAKAAAEAKAAEEAAATAKRNQEEAQRQAELAAEREARLKAEADSKAALAKAQADAAAYRAKVEADAEAAKAKADADAAEARARTEADALRAREEAAKAEAERIRKAAEDLRAQLLDQFNRILETRDTERGLVVNMGDVLFDTAKFDLRPAARERLAKLSGIVLGHPGLALAVEGHTDSTGSDEFNQKLSGQRAASVREYLITQGLADSTVTTQGFGSSMPIADNSTAAGRQKNRRVEIIVSGEIIGTKVGH